MADPYTNVSVSGYNTNPPSDDGAQTEANRVKWSTIKSKLPDPLKTAIEAIDTNVGSAFDKVSGGVVSKGVDYTVTSSDQGKLIRCTASGITITTPNATSVGEPFQFFVLNDSTGDITVDGSGSQDIDGENNITIPPGGGVHLQTTGTNWYTSGQNYTRTLVLPQGRLTATSNAAVITSDQSAVTSIFYTPYVGNLVPIPDGTNQIVREFSQLTLTLAAQHLANNIYDVFAAVDPADDSTVIIGTGPAWSTPTAGSGARGSGAGTTQLSRIKGLWANTVSMTLRNGATTYSIGASEAIYLGSIFMDGSNGQVTCHVTSGQSRKFGVWNAYNRVPITLRCHDATASWTYNTATIRQSRATAGNTIAAFTGLAEEMINAVFSQNLGSETNGPLIRIGIGVNSTTAFSGMTGWLDPTGGATPMAGCAIARHTRTPDLGVNDINTLEVNEDATAAGTFYGGSDDFLLTVSYMG